VANPKIIFLAYLMVGDLTNEIQLSAEKQQISFEK